MSHSEEALPSSVAETLEDVHPAAATSMAATDPAAEDVPNATSTPEATKDADGHPSSGGDAGCSSHSQEEGDPLALAEELFEKGSKAIEDEDFVTAVDCLSRALEIRVSHHGELAPECATAYYKYGCALLYKAQEEADPLGIVPKEHTTSAASAVSGQKENDGSMRESVPSQGQVPTDNIIEDQGKEENTGGDMKADDESSDDDEVDDVTGEDEDDDSDLDLAWKMLDIARAISERCSGDTIEKAKIFSALAEVSMEREDFEASLADYQRALSIVENLVEPDHRRIIELNFRICLVLEVGSKIKDAIPYCEKAITLCTTRLQLLKEDLLKIKTSTPLPHSEPSISFAESNSEPAEVHGHDCSLQEKEEEIQVISGFQTELEKKLEDLQQAVSNPKSILSEYLKMVSEKAAEVKDDKPVETNSFASSSQVGTIKNPFDPPAISTAATNGSITHLGVVGRGVKRASVVPLDREPSKIPAIDLAEKIISSTSENADSDKAQGLAQ